MTRRLLMLAPALLAGCAGTLSPGPTLPAAPTRSVAVGYLPAFKGLDAIVARTDFSHYTHVNLAFVNPAPDGSVVGGEAMACMNGAAGAPVSLASLRQAVGRIHAAGAKVLVSLGGGTIPACSGDWAALLRPATRDTVVRALVALADAERLDGIDIDLEGELLTRIDRAGDYVPFVEALGRALHARGKLLTCATASYEGGMVPIGSIPWFDLVNVMSYDAIGPSWGRPGEEHASPAMAERDMALWRSRGVPRDRLVLGVPFYGRGFGTFAPNHAFRDIIRDRGLPAVQGDTLGTRCAGCDYVSFNGIDTIRAKGRLAREQGAGVMVWEVSQDTDDALLIRTLTAADARGTAR